MSKVYWKGTRYPKDCVVLLSVDGEIWANLPLYLEEADHSRTGFEWGYGGSGPTQLAYAILRTYFELALGFSSEEAAETASKEHYQFTVDVVYNHFGRSEEWKLNSDQIRIWRSGGGI